MKVIDNGIVSMQWDASCYYESKRLGFVGAANWYEGIKGKLPVLFHEKKAYVLLNDEGDILDTDEISAELKSFIESDDTFEDYFEGRCVVLADMFGVEDDMLSMYGLTDFSDDIEKRLVDLSGYWGEEIVDAM